MKYLLKKKSRENYGIATKKDIPMSTAAERFIDLIGD